MDNINTNITIGLSHWDFYPAIFSLLDICSGLRSLNLRSHTVISIYYTLRNISREILSLKEHIDNGLLKKSAAYEDIIAKYNDAILLYKDRANDVVEIARANHSIGDIRHCPTCGVDIGKEVTRARNCPSCKNRIVLYRINPDECVLLSRDDEARVNEAVKACNDIDYPVLLLAYTIDGEMLIEFNKRLQIDEDRERIEAKANDLLVT